MKTDPRRRRGGGAGAAAAGPGCAAAYSSGAGRRRLRVILWLAVGWLVGAGVAAASVGFTARVETVIDGDTLEVRRGRDVVRLRLYGIDCPEGEQPRGPAATRFAAALAVGRTVTVRVRDTDDYGRLVAEVDLPDGRSLNRELLRAGHAWWYRRYAADPELERLEAEARLAGRGLWGAPDPVPPWRWRREHPDRAR
ncbi:MAG: thermonuclease family protein [Deferrisomatales bacterium]|nr:thermonuclease family protein [Deferrisomatales bacterium]